MNWITATVNNCIEGLPGPKIKASSRGEHLIGQYVELLKDIPLFLDGMALPNGPFKKGQVVRVDERLARPLEILIAKGYAIPFRGNSNE
ncbi:MAG: hypothetical protein HPY60_11900 [Candidatus Methanofastidiosum sp.]|nr:hypothetical protein [Methanofastidiosum sp.]